MNEGGPVAGDLCTYHLGIFLESYGSLGLRMTMVAELVTLR